MTLLNPASRDEAAAAPSEQACLVCGGHALVEDTPHEFADGLGDRAICQKCGAHRVDE